MVTDISTTSVFRITVWKFSKYFDISITKLSIFIPKGKSNTLINWVCTVLYTRVKLWPWLREWFCRISERSLQSNNIFFHGLTELVVFLPPNFWGFEITLRHNTVGTNPLEEWSALRRNLYITTRNTRNVQTSIPPAGFEPASPASERPPDPRLRPPGHWDRQKNHIRSIKS
jgi:hypothetical protein